jgi:hypothetical protein
MSIKFILNDKKLARSLHRQIREILTKHTSLFQGQANDVMATLVDKNI